ncbi:hypothetical protein [Campylobacter blaseri]|nr:hypothetical protein [Campylobacter blaseri]
MEKENLDPVDEIKALYYIGTQGLVIEVSTNDLFQNVTVKDSNQKKFNLSRNTFKNKFCFSDNLNTELCLNNNLATFKTQTQNLVKLVLVSIEK